MEDVGLNPTRTALLEVLRRAGALVDAEVTATLLGEPRGTVRVRAASHLPLTIQPDEVPGLIDELPALAVLGLLGAGMRVTGAGELRTKESDRITALVAGLRAMGAGKSSLARALAARLGWRAEDVDELVEAREGRAIADIFRDRGEAYFRAVERDVLLGLVPLRHAVVATGGGTFGDSESRASMLADGTVVWIDVPFTEIVDRIPTDGRRPLARTRADLERLYLARQAAYMLAHVRIDAGAAPVAEVVELVLDRLGW
jgi:shikimate kinase